MTPGKAVRGVLAALHDDDERGDEQIGQPARPGRLVGRFQTIPGQRGALVVRATSSDTTW
ncbi:hypothetical protein OG218_13560 [Kineococcus sp. NBC_00420]|uniref:hypothetical protein n=1 Tax=Kineococcus sp. NBC_00420 TaxID=2903564 RepID=UPI002E23A21E